MSRLQDLKLKKGSLLQYIKGPHMNEVVTVEKIHPMSETPWLDSNLVDLSDGESFILDVICPGDSSDPCKNQDHFLVVISSEDNKWVFEDVSPKYTEENDIPYISVTDKDGKPQTMPNPNYVPENKRRFEYAVLDAPYKDFETDLEDQLAKEELKKIESLKKSSKEGEVITKELDYNGFKPVSNFTISTEHGDLPVEIADPIRDICRDKSFNDHHVIGVPGVFASKYDSVVVPLIDSCNKKTINLQIDVEADLVDKDLMKLINTQFGPEYKEAAISHILSKLNIKDLVDAIREALTRFYAEEVKCSNKVNKNADEVLEEQKQEPSKPKPRAKQSANKI